MPVKSDTPNKSNEPDVVELPRENVAPTEVSKQDLPEQKEQQEVKPQSYVHLADGTVLRVNDEDLPVASGTNNTNGYWQKGNKVFHVIGVYPVEITVEENK